MLLYRQRVHALAEISDRDGAAGQCRILAEKAIIEPAAVTDALALTPEEQERWKLYGYTDQMGAAMAAADAIVSRAGASSLAEISARALPALLVPFPFATEDHQTTNARAAVDAGCAFMVADADVEGDEFASLLLRLVDDADLRARMREAARAQKTADAAELLADVVMKAAARKAS